MKYNHATDKETCSIGEQKYSVGCPQEVDINVYCSKVHGLVLRGLLFRQKEAH